MDSRHALTQIVVLMTCGLLTSLATMTSSSLRDDEDEGAGSYYSPDMNQERETNQEDISKLLLKHLRFRQLPDSDLPMTSAAFSAGTAAMHGNEVHKRKEQRRLVSNLAALLSGLRDRQSESNMRMPSLRFGK